MDYTLLTYGIGFNNNHKLEKEIWVHFKQNHISQKYIDYCFIFCTIPVSYLSNFHFDPFTCVYSKTIKF